MGLLWKNSETYPEFTVLMNMMHIILLLPVLLAFHHMRYSAPRWANCVSKQKKNNSNLCVNKLSRHFVLMESSEY